MATNRGHAGCGPWPTIFAWPRKTRRRWHVSFFGRAKHGAVLLLGLGLGPLASCGYHVAGQGDLVPKGIHTVAVPPFRNATVRFKLTDRLAEAMSHEFIARTQYRVIADPDQADAVLRGTVTNVVSY